MYKFYSVVFHFYIFFISFCYHEHVTFGNKNRKCMFSLFFYLLD
jgi:hypothetical protein